MISLSKDDFSFIGTDLIRPECVVLIPDISFSLFVFLIT